MAREASSSPSLALSTLIDRQTNGKRNAIPEICILLMPTERRTDAQIPSIMWGGESKKEMETQSLNSCSCNCRGGEKESESESESERRAGVE